MKHLIIHNVGPISNVDISLSKYNFIIGSQCSGKSTIAKVLSTCEWIEKEVATTRDEHVIENGDSFVKTIEDFHRMEGYFDRTKNSYVLYETDCITIVYDEKQLDIKLKKDSKYFRQKICYIPAERNMVALSELNGFEFKGTSLRSFLFDWWSARECYTPSNKTELLDLGVKYYYDKEQTSKQVDRIQHDNGVSYDISLNCSSSGLQSVTPLLIMLQYYTNQYFDDFGKKTSFDIDTKTKKTSHALVREIALAKYKPGFEERDAAELVKKFNEELYQGNPRVQQIFKEYEEAFRRLTVPNRVTFIIEEPEQNLYPYTQIQLIESLCGLCGADSKHGFTLTTHSPYILNFLNVLFLRFYSKSDSEICMNPDDVTAFVMQDGNAHSLVCYNEEYKRKNIKAEDLTDTMRAMSNEYNLLKSKL